MFSTQSTQVWTDRLDRFEQVDLTVAQFCLTEGVSQASYYYWRRKIRQSPPGSAVRPTRSLARFIPVALSSSALPPPRSVMTVDLPGGIRIRFEIPAPNEALNQAHNQAHNLGQPEGGRPS